jgi:hypothetical protein
VDLLLRFSWDKDLEKRDEKYDEVVNFNQLQEDDDKLNTQHAQKHRM